MGWKYADELSSLGDCPPGTARPCERDAYRFVFAEIDDARNYLPVAKLNPYRRLDSVDEHCHALALSFFATKAQAELRYRQLAKRNKKIGKTLGTHLAQCRLTHADGAATPVANSGHFDLFESNTVELAGRFSVVEAIL